MDRTSYYESSTAIDSVLQNSIGLRYCAPYYSHLNTFERLPELINQTARNQLLLQKVEKF